MKEISSMDTLSGKEGRAYAKINGNNEEMFYARSINAKVEKSKGQVKAIGKRMVGHKTTGAEGTGSMTIYYLSPMFREQLAEWKRTGVDAYFDMVIENSDPLFWPCWTVTPTIPCRRMWISPSRTSRSCPRSIRSDFMRALRCGAPLL